MTHTIHEGGTSWRASRIPRGQVEAVERPVVAEVGCPDVLQLVASIRGAVHGLTAELVEEHISLARRRPRSRPGSGSS